MTERSRSQVADHLQASVAVRVAHRDSSCLPRKLYLLRQRQSGLVKNVDGQRRSPDVYVLRHAIEPAVDIPGLQCKDMRALGGAERLMERRPKRLSHYTAVQICLNRADRDGIEVHVGRHQER